MTALGHADIAGLIPHDGAMCLLDQVVSWNDEGIVCAATSHRNPDHPMAQDGRLDAVCGLEYACQAMAAHGALLASSRSAVGYVAVVRDMALHVGRLDDLPGALDITAIRLMGEGARVIYRFSVHSDGRELVSGRVAVVLA